MCHRPRDSKPSSQDILFHEEVSSTRDRFESFSVVGSSAGRLEDVPACSGCFAGLRLINAERSVAPLLAASS